MAKLYSHLSVAVDLIQSEMKLTNAIEIAEAIETHLGLEFSIHQISDYLDINRMENYEYESKLINY